MYIRITGDAVYGDGRLIGIVLPSMGFPDRYCGTFGGTNIYGATPDAVAQKLAMLAVVAQADGDVDKAITLLRALADNEQGEQKEATYA